MKGFTSVKALLLLSSLAWIDLTEGLVNLTVEGGVSLVGPHCPGTLRLFCEGSDLTSLRWSYNSLSIVSFLPVDREGTRTPSRIQYPAFLLVELTKAVQNSNPVFGNFSSILTVDLSKLQEQNVVNISCGDPRTIQTEPVGVTIIQQDIPDSPNITEVTATYDSRQSLKRITVSWNKVSTGCPEYAFSLDYIVQLNGWVPLRISHSSCGEISCLAVFNTTFSQSNPVNSYFLSLMAMNNIGNSSTVQFPTVIPSQSEQYITPVLSSSGCITSGQCLSSGNLQNDTTCHVQYTTDPEYQSLSTAIMAPLNTLFEVPWLTSGTIFYFVISVPVTSTFHVNEQFELTTELGPQLTSDNMATIAFAVVFVTVSLILFISSLIIISVGHVGDSSDCGRCLKATVLVLLVICVLLLISCLALLIAVGVVVGTQEDTCNTDWLQQRDRLTISTLIISLSSVLASLAMMVTVLFYINHGRKGSYSTALLTGDDKGDEHLGIPVGRVPRSPSLGSRFFAWITGRKPKASQPSREMQSPISDPLIDTGGTGDRPSDKITDPPKQQDSSMSDTEEKEEHRECIQLPRTVTVQGNETVANEGDQLKKVGSSESFSRKEETVQEQPSVQSPPAQISTIEPVQHTSNPQIQDNLHPATEENPSDHQNLNTSNTEEDDFRGTGQSKYVRDEAVPCNETAQTEDGTSGSFSLKENKKNETEAVEDDETVTNNEDNNSLSPDWILVP